MPSVAMGRRETDRKKLPMEEARSIGYGIARMLTEERDEALIDMLHAFLVDRVSDDYIKWSFAPDHVGETHCIAVAGAIELPNGKIFVKELSTNRVSQHDSLDWAGPLLLRDILFIMWQISGQISFVLTFKNPDKIRDIENAAYLLSMVDV